ncbi:16S rRNA (uracil(1498)-N(3))-methyltransferase [Teredinibacter purpureus]|jgi:RNA methyltransferase, RsmE family|uniref:16S rRNA (uracil(1498)-N(3))-methyltransferase n=1 Tax=Teredinibacter purpureus TaxID=2731756 RepID=UPI0005F87435|nr:16S rRNA (uracil(1498)-N(3))-methyltransferase [Teredinibacter purpureus]
MNLLLLQAKHIQSASPIALSKKQSEHIINVLKLSTGDSLRVGVINGQMGYATVVSLGETVYIALQTLDQQPTPALPLTLILALPRPQMIKRILQTIACMGVERLCLIQTSKVEKSFWQSPAVTDESIESQLILGLEQGVATQLPIIEKHLRFRPFAEDTLPSLTTAQNSYIAHPGPYSECPRLSLEQRATVAIGPEGGFSEQEVGYFEKCGFTPVQMGARILKVETAVTALLAKLY